MTTLSIVIPVWGRRPEFELCFRRNRSTFLEASAQVILCTDDESFACIRDTALSVVTGPGAFSSSVWLLNGGQNAKKSSLLNQGCRACVGSLLLFCDCDVVVPGETLHALTAQAQCGKVAHVARILADTPCITNESHIASIRDLVELTTADGRVVIVEKAAIYPTQSARSGPGIVCVEKTLFERVGGYNGGITSYGWEDIDLLIRLGLVVGAASIAVGYAYHFGQPLKGAELDRRLLEESRNFQICRANYCLGELRGSLSDLEQPCVEQIFPTPNGERNGSPIQG
jgi:hypothetical protein